MAGRKYMVYADKYSGWTEVALMHQVAKAFPICNILRRYFVNYGVPEEVTCDGRPPYYSDELKRFLRTWGISQRVSSAYYPQSNGRAMAAVKHMKRIFMTNISPSGSLDTDEVAKALLLHHNTPPPDLGASPAEILFACPLNDYLLNPMKFCHEWLQMEMEESSKQFLTHARIYNSKTA